MSENGGIQIKIPLKTVIVIMAMIMGGMGYELYPEQMDRLIDIFLGALE